MPVSNGKPARRLTGLRAVSTLALIAGCCLLTGCETDSFINPAEPHIQPPNGKPLAVSVLDSLGAGIEEPDSAFSNATEVEPADLVADTSDYHIGKNDTLSVSLYDLEGEGTGEEVRSVTVTETGMINLPYVPAIEAAGYTEKELQDKISKAYKDAQLKSNLRVSVTVTIARARTFTVAQANATAPGEYQITRADFRILDALVAARAPANPIGVDYAYVIRRAPEAPPVDTSTPSTEPTSTTPTTSPGDLLTPQGMANPAPTASPSDVATTVQPSAALSTAQPAASNAPFKFDDIAPVSDQRVIRVPIDRLLSYGELQYNIVIRPGDMIIVPFPQTGVYYMGGHVARIGVYSLSGTKVDIKQAWTAAGGPDDFAIPRRSEIIRRVGGNKEVFVRIDLGKIWAGEQPDFYLKPNDTVEVGTDLLATFLAAIRNGFRTSYGFGFIYDRNFYTGNFF